MSTRPHTLFVEVKIHTAKCDLCDKHNKLTVYRCAECGQHVCTLCKNKRSGDGTHVFHGGSRSVPGSNINQVVHKNDEADMSRDSRSQGKIRAGRRVHVISDDEDEDIPVLKPAPTTQKYENKVIENSNHHTYHEDDLPRLWPIAVPTANTSAAEGPNRMIQRTTQIHEDENDSERQRTERYYNNLGRRTVPSPYAFVRDREVNSQSRCPTQSSLSHQQATHSAPLHAQPTMYQLRSGPDVDQQAARIQCASVNTQPRNCQAPRAVQPSLTHQQANHSAPPYPQRAIYRPKPGADVDRQAARNQLSFANPQRHGHQAPRPAQALISPQHAPAPAIMDQLAARNYQVFRSYQQAQAKNMEARNRQTLSSHQNAWPVANSDQVAAYNHQAFVSNQQALSAANHPEQMAAAGERQQAYPSQQQAIRPTSSSAETSGSFRNAIGSSPFPSQAFLHQQYAALLASRQTRQRIATQDRSSRSPWGNQVRGRSPAILEAADVLLSYAGVEQGSGGRFRPAQDADGVSQLLSAADQLSEASSAPSKSSSCSKTLVDRSGAAGTHPVSPHPRSADADSADARLDRHQARLAGSHSTSGTRNTVSDLPVSPHGQRNDRRATSHPGPSPPMSDHAATYINQWNSGRAALSSSVRSTAADVPATQLDHPRPPAPALHPHSSIGVRDITASGSESGEATEAGSQAVGAPKSVPGGQETVDVVMSSPDVEILDDDRPCRGETLAPEEITGRGEKERGAEDARIRAIPEPHAEGEGKAGKHWRGEKKREGETSKEQKALGDVDVVDARKRASKDKHSDEVDDDGSDVEITSWNKLDDDTSADEHRRTNDGAKALQFGRAMKRGVAHVKRREPQGQKGKTTSTCAG